MEKRFIIIMISIVLVLTAVLCAHLFFDRDMIVNVGSDGEINRGVVYDENVTEVPFVYEDVPFATIEFGGIDWLVLDENDDRKLMISKYILDVKSYHNVAWESITWADSSIRSWLNSEFYNQFSEAERMRIVETNLVNNDNLWIGTAGGANTVDKIFLLSTEEIVRYFGDSGQLEIPHEFPDEQWWGFNDQYRNTRKAREQNGRFYEPWWLRSPGSVTLYAAFIDSDGSVFVAGSIMVDHVLGIRPAMWIYQ